MEFSKLLKRVDLSDSKPFVLALGVISAQYNPKRFKSYQGLHNGPGKDTLDMRYSPHVRFLTIYEQEGDGLLDDFSHLCRTDYYKMHKKYGKDHDWIKNKIRRFIGLYQAMKNGEGIDKPIILSRPIVENRYNSTYEIYEGHHRVACAVMLDRSEIECLVINQ